MSMLQLDKQEIVIVRELIRNPRLSDNQIGKKTWIPIKTVNRKRKLLEEQGLLNYFTYLNNTPSGTNVMQARKLFIIEFKYGLTRELFMEKMGTLPTEPGNFFSKHVSETYLAESDGRLALITIIEGEHEHDLLDIFNSKVVPLFNELFGNDVIIKIITLPIYDQLAALHNYYFGLNLEKGKMKADWPDENIFVI